MPDEAIGLVGLGLLGSAIGERLLASGFGVLGFDVDPAARNVLAAQGGTAGESAAHVAGNCRRIILSLPTSAVVRSVIDEMQPRLQAGAIVIDTTTGAPAEMAEFGLRLQEHDVAYVDATVGGSSRQVREREAIVMAGGSGTAFVAAGDLIATFSRQTFHMGPTGSGARMKLVMNLVLGLNRAVLAEGLSFARALGLDGRLTLEVLKAGPSWSRAMDTKGTRMLDGNFSPEARLAQHVKDVRLILDAGAGNGIPLPLSEVHCGLLERLVEADCGELDNSAIIKAYKRLPPFD